MQTIYPNMLINRFTRYQNGLTLNMLYPSQGNKCACGCGKELSKSRKKWYSNECRQLAYINFSIIKGDINTIRQQLYEIDKGACRNCGLISDNWEADHIVPVYKGGGGCTLENLQTLCYDCHKEKTYNLCQEWVKLLPESH